MAIKYFDDGDLACVDGYSFRKDKKTGYFLSSKPIDGHRIRLHIYMWQRTNGKVPKGYEIHHIDGDKNNNELDNLQLMTKTDHAKLHGSLLSDEQKKQMAERLIKCAIPKATEWHKSEEGRKWHSIHAKEIFNQRESVEYICSNCGKTFETLHRYSSESNHFCSNSCKSAYRRKKGFDNIEKKCERCNNVFIENKYVKNTCCSECRSIIRQENRERRRLQFRGLANS